MRKARIFDIQRNSFVDGPGIRTVVFLKGCNMRCEWCHNPESWIPEAQLLFYPGKCVGCGRCAAACPNGATADRAKCTGCGACARVCMHGARMLCGRDSEATELLDVIGKDRPFYDASGGGITFTGGECMLQADFLEELLPMCRAAGIHTAIDTAGNVPWSAFKRIEPLADLFLYDVKCATEALHKRFTGATNARIVGNLEKLLGIAPEKVWVRTPVVPGFNAEIEEMRLIKGLIDGMPAPPARVELLPYHRLGEGKRVALGYANDFAPEPPSDGEMAKYRAIMFDG